MKNALHAYLAVPFKMLAVLVGIYQKNRDRVAHLMARPDMRKLFRAAIVITALAWIAIWMIAGEADRGRLNEAMRELFSGFIK